MQTTVDAEGASTSAGAPSVSDATPDVDDDGDLGLAWEMAELARVILTANKDAAVDAASRLAEAHELLADISAEKEQFDPAINDFEEVRFELCMSQPVQVFGSERLDIAPIVTAISFLRSSLEPQTTENRMRVRCKES